MTAKIVSIWQGGVNCGTGSSLGSCRERLGKREDAGRIAGRDFRGRLP
jgi:hypothetical protein